MGEMNQAELEAYEERIAICMECGHLPHDEAIKVANEMIERMRDEEE